MKTETDVPSFYTVGGTVHTSKIAAVLSAQRSGTDVEWHYNDAVFDNFNWLVEPEESLSYFYKERAKQIREQYDYVVLLCSGGADSSCVLDSFVSNGIMPDEVIGSAPISGLNQFEANSSDSTAANTMSETALTQLPMLARLAAKYPEIKVTINDYFPTILATKEDAWIEACDDWIHPSSAARYSFEAHPHLVKLADSGKRIAFVYGIDKPNVVRSRKGSLDLSFCDLAINVMRSPFARYYPNVTNVMFYWGADPRLMSKQAHTVVNTMRTLGNPITAWMLDWMMPPKSYQAIRQKQGKYERAIVPFIYPVLPVRTFQADKPTKLFLGEHDEWFYTNHGGLRSCELMISESNSFLSRISTKFLNGGRNGLVTFTKTYTIST